MIPRKLLEAAFRQFWVLLLPVALAPLAVLQLTGTQPTYYSEATVWVARPDNIDPGVFSGNAGPWSTPAQAQAEVLRDLLATRSFRDAVATEAGLRGEGGTRIVGREVSVFTAGTSLVAVSARSTDQVRPQALVAAVVNQFRQKSAAESERQASLTVEYYTKQLGVASKELDLRRAELSAFLAANPRASDPQRPDATYLRLQGNVDTQSKLVDGLVASLQGAQRALASAPQALDATFSVQDQATPPEEIAVPITKRYGLPAAGLAAGILVAAAYLYTVYRTDHAIRSSQDLADLPVPLLGYVPELPRKYRGLFEAMTPLRWIPWRRHRDYARAVAASISIIPAREARA